LQGVFHDTGNAGSLLLYKPSTRCISTRHICLCFDQRLSISLHFSFTDNLTGGHYVLYQRTTYLTQVSLHRVLRQPCRYRKSTTPQRQQLAYDLPHLRRNPSQRATPYYRTTKQEQLYLHHRHGYAQTT